MSSCEYIPLPQTLRYLSEENQNANPASFTSTHKRLLRAKNRQTNKKIVRISNVEISHNQTATVRTKLNQIQYE